MLLFYIKYFKTDTFINYTVMDFWGGEYGMILTRKTNIDRGGAEINISGQYHTLLYLTPYNLIVIGYKSVTCHKISQMFF